MERLASDWLLVLDTPKASAGGSPGRLCVKMRCSTHDLILDEADEEAQLPPLNRARRHNSGCRLAFHANWPYRPYGGYQ